MAAKKTQSNRKPNSRTAKPATGALRLLGKVAVVTGGSRGIGYAIARALAAEGCSVVITGRDPSTLAQSAAPHYQFTSEDYQLQRRDRRSLPRSAMFAIRNPLPRYLRR